MAKESKGNPTGKGKSGQGKSTFGKAQNRQVGKLNRSKIPDFKFTPPAPKPTPKDYGKSSKE